MSNKKSPAAKYLSASEMAKTRGAPRRPKAKKTLKPIPTHSMKQSPLKRKGSFTIKKKLDVLQEANVPLADLFKG